MIRILSLLLVLGILPACATRRVITVYDNVEIGDGGKLLRDLYRSFWTPPGRDDDPLRIGLAYGQKVVRFRALTKLRIRAYSENQSWEVASPQGVVWRVERRSIVRPAVESHFAVVDSQILARKQEPSSSDVRPWRKKGFSSARWMAPPQMDTGMSEEVLRRWILAITPATSQPSAEAICKKVREMGHPNCRVYSRIEIPPLAQAVLRAENGNFSREFQGFLAIHSFGEPVEVLDFIREERTMERSNEKFGPQLFVVPESSGLLSLVQSTSLGNYLEGVVPSETFPGAHEEALKAQATIARTYAIHHVNPKFSPKPFLLCASTDCQVYRGESLKTDTTSEAVRNTDGLVLWEKNGRLADTYYHSICGGHTEPKSRIWGPPEPFYLRGVSDLIPNQSRQKLESNEAVSRLLRSDAVSYCGRSSYTRDNRWRWTHKYDRGKIRGFLKKAGLKPPLKDIRVRKRGVSGRILDLELRTASGPKRIRGEYRIRMFFGGLLSSLVVFEKEYDANSNISFLRIRGGGYGHGVGLCQVGAIGRAEAGYKFEEILAHYYPGTSLAPLSPN